MVGKVQPAALALYRRIEQRSPHDLPGRHQTRIQIDGSNHGLKCIGKQRRFLPAAGFLLAAAQAKVLAQPQPARYLT